MLLASSLSPLPRMPGQRNFPGSAVRTAPFGRLIATRRQCQGFGRRMNKFESATSHQADRAFRFLGLRDVLAFEHRPTHNDTRGKLREPPAARSPHDVACFIRASRFGAMHAFQNARHAGAPRSPMRADARRHLARNRLVKTPRGVGVAADTRPPRTVAVPGADGGGRKERNPPKNMHLPSHPGGVPLACRQNRTILNRRRIRHSRHHPCDPTSRTS